ncbi:MAG: hypothetical protein LBT79_07920 [Elusimicrobiota bacterium]|jgi:hypothetical protein|nr:hypothetical protein [Elusimicrobiota bacterium]
MPQTDILKLICDIVQKEMSLPDGRVWIYNQKRELPTDENIFIVVGLSGSDKMIGNSRRYKRTLEGLEEILCVNVLTFVSIDITSKNTDARMRRFEIPLALGSSYSQQIQEKYSFSVGKIGQVVDVSAAEGTSMLNRFNLTFNITHAVEKNKAVDYYDKFEKPQIKEEDNG